VIAALRAGRRIGRVSHRGWPCLMGLRTAPPRVPWDTWAVREPGARAPARHVDLSVGTPVDPTPAVVRDALAPPPTGRATDHARHARAACAAWSTGSRAGAACRASTRGVLPTVGSKDWWRSCRRSRSGAGDVRGAPRTAYPTYDVGARLAARHRCRPTTSRRGRHQCPARVAQLAGQPDGSVLSVAQLREWDAARAIVSVVASDECYAELAWQEPWVSAGVPSLLTARHGR